MTHIRLHVVGDCDIEVDGYHIVPSASHLFALLLLLASERARWLSRQEIQDLLFAESSQADLASHSLRQMLYRLRRMSIQFEERPAGLKLADNQVQGPLESLYRKPPTERANILPASLRVLPSYSPKLSPAYLEWVEEFRDATERELKHLLLADISRLRSTHSWDALARLSGTLQTLDPLNADIAIAGAEARSMLGQRHQALQFIDSYVRDAGHEVAQGGRIRRLRARISKSVSGKALGPLYGRQECLALLDAAWADAERGGARLAVIVGAGGLGKTRVAEEFAAQVTLNEATVIHHRCDVHSRDHPLSLFSHILPRLRAMRGSLGVAPHYQDLLDRLHPSQSTSPTSIPIGVSLEALRSELQSALVDILEAVSAEQRLLLVVDDAHLLDAASSALLHHLSTSINSAALLAIACCRPPSHALSLLEFGERTTSYALTPLSDAESRDLISALIGTELEPQVLETCIMQSGGNPFYLHALARHHWHSARATDVPVDVKSLASSSYFSLARTERLVLESCLLLGRYATLARVALVTGLDDLALTTAFRMLEEHSLVCLVDDVIRGPHSLLDDAISALVPQTVRALLNKRVAQVLSGECTSGTYSTSMALAASHSWLAAGDTSSALELTRRCAREAAAIGEPAVAADLLTQMVRAALPLDSRRFLLDDLIRYADAGGLRVVVAEALRDRLALARQAREPQSDIRRMQLRIIEADILNGTDHLSAIPALTAMLDSAETEPDLGIQCVVSLLIIADAEYDTELAVRLFEWMIVNSHNFDRTNVNAQRAELVYHTTFGQIGRAVEIVHDLIQCFPLPMLDDDCRTARRFASYALYRMVMPAEARSILEADYKFMSTHGIRSEALYAASLLTEIAIGQGDFRAAEYWFGETGKQLGEAKAHKLSPNSGYYSSAALFAMMRGQYQEAEALITAPQAEDSRMRTARYEAICCALLLRLYLMKGEIGSHADLVARLRTLYSRGRTLGGQDTVVELLWCADVLAGREDDASELLSAYLNEYRREAPSAEWSLRNTTAADAAWNRLL